MVVGKVFSRVCPMTRVCAFQAREGSVVRPARRRADARDVQRHRQDARAPHRSAVDHFGNHTEVAAASIGPGNELLAWQVRARSIYKFGNCCISSRASQRSLERRCFVSKPTLHVLQASRSPGAAALWRVQLARIHRKHRFREANQHKTAAGHPSAGQAERSDPHDALIG